MDRNKDKANIPTITPANFLNTYAKFEIPYALSKSTS